MTPDPQKPSETPQTPVTPPVQTQPTPVTPGQPTPPTPPVDVLVGVPDQPSPPATSNPSPVTPEAPVEETTDDAPIPDWEPRPPFETPSPQEVRIEILYLDQIAQSLALLVERSEPITPTPGPYVENETKEIFNPVTEIPVEGNPEEIILPDGRRAPAKVVRALTEYAETTWPGVMVPEARAAIAHLVIATMEDEKQPALRTNYPFCLDDNKDVREKSSPCIKRSGHRGKHQDNNDGVW